MMLIPFLCPELFFLMLCFSVYDRGVKLVVCWISSLWKWVIWCSACCNWLKSHCFEIVKYQNCFIVKIYSHEKSKFWFAGQTDSQFCYQGNSLFIFKSPRRIKWWYINLYNLHVNLNQVYNLKKISLCIFYGTLLLEFLLDSLPANSCGVAALACLLICW